jgi:hypothetical protein
MVGTLDEALAAARQRQQQPLSQLDRDIIGGPIRLPIHLRPDPQNLRRTAKQLRGYADAMTEILEREDMSDRSKLLQIRFALIGLRSKYEERSPDRRITPKAATGETTPHAPSSIPKHRRVVGPAPISLDRFAATPDFRDAIERWQEWFTSERRCSPHTLAAYGRDLAAFLDFLAEHLGAGPGGPRGAQARRLQGLSRSRQRPARSFFTRPPDAVLRNFLRFLARRGLAQNAALLLIRTPKQPKLLPKALTVEDAAAVLTAAGVGSAHLPWLAKRDVALVTLLYGCGLRISEALALTRADAPIEPGTITVTGKGDKQRVVPVLPAVA